MEITTNRKLLFLLIKKFKLCCINILHSTQPIYKNYRLSYNQTIFKTRKIIIIYYGK
jgi:hypothetical protein